MFKPDAEDRKKLNERELLALAEQKLSGLDRSGLGHSSAFAFAQKFFKVDQLYYEDVEERLSEAQWISLLDSRQRDLLFQQNAYLVKNTLIKQGSPPGL